MTTRKSAKISMLSNFSLVSSPISIGDEEDEQRENEANMFNATSGDTLLDFGEEPRILGGTTNVEMKYDHQHPMTHDGEQQVVMNEGEDLSNDSTENSCCEDAVVRLKRDMLELLKDEFTCCICEEIVIKATVTKCSHMFCAYCLRESKKIRTTCPICRAQRILERPARSVDEFITKMVTLISEDIAARRSALIRERDVIKPKRTTNRTTRVSLMTLMRTE